MKALLPLASTLALATLLLTAQAQSLPVVTSKNIDPKGAAATKKQTADRRAAAYKGPKVVKSTEKLGDKMIRDSKPTDTVIPEKARKQ